jgi:hypothetical protein
VTALDDYDCGYADGVEEGRRRAEAEIAQSWAELARSIRRDAERLRGPVPEPQRREQHDDSIWFTPAERAIWAGEA